MARARPFASTTAPGRVTAGSAHPFQHLRRIDLHDRHARHPDHPGRRRGTRRASATIESGLAERPSRSGRTRARRRANPARWLDRVDPRGRCTRRVHRGTRRGRRGMPRDPDRARGAGRTPARGSNASGDGRQPAVSPRIAAPRADPRVSARQVPGWPAGRSINAADRRPTISPDPDPSGPPVRRWKVKSPTDSGFTICPLPRLDGLEPLITTVGPGCVELAYPGRASAPGWVPVFAASDGTIHGTEGPAGSAVVRLKHSGDWATQYAELQHVLTRPRRDGHSVHVQAGDVLGHVRRADLRIRVTVFRPTGDSRIVVDPIEEMRSWSLLPWFTEPPTWFTEPTSRAPSRPASRGDPPPSPARSVCAQVDRTIRSSAAAPVPP
jgi:hypothetical protein